MVSPDGDLRTLFVDEASEGIAELEATLLQLEKSSDDREAVGLIFRIVGSLRGRSAMMRFSELASFAHATESLLDQLRRGVRPVTPLVVDALLASVDVLRGLVLQIAVNPEAAGELDENAERVRGLIVSFVEEPPGVSMRSRPV